MKKLVLLASVLVLASTSCQNSREDNKMSLDENKKISTLYHDRNLEDVDKLLTDDFVGSYYHSEPKPTIWNKENHKNAIKNYPNVKDSLLIQIAEDDWVAERFTRTYKYEGKIMKAEVMQFKQFKNGKIIRSWELFSPIDTI
jgi:uncharacterized protein YktB (UPF0637 family)